VLERVPFASVEQKIRCNIRKLAKMVDMSSSAAHEKKTGKDASSEVAAIPLLEERLCVTKRQVETGRVRVHVTVEEREEIIREHLQRDDLHVERVPRNVRVTEEPHVRLEGNTTIVPVVEEVLVVEKALMLVEEVHITRRSTSEMKELPVVVRSERISVDREPASDPVDTAGVQP
jgi:uncharacterized protein (TIGR02271 family)